nr:NDP-sugar synthase [Candidatus Sigynarchaeota archaeon]
EATLMDFGKNVFPYLLENNHQIFGFVEQYYWMDVGQSKPYLWANWDLLRRYGWPITPNGIDHDNLWYKTPPALDTGSSICAPASFGDNVSIGKNSSVSPLSVIGNNVRIGDDSVIEKSVIWDNVTIGNNCRIAESIVCNDVDVHDRAYLDECVVGPRSTIPKDATRKYEKITRDG